MTSAVTIEKLHKDYDRKTALEDITFEVREGSCFGLVGPNGAGKSTTMKILTGLLEPTSGVAKVFGLDTQQSPKKIKRLLGYVPQSITLYEKLSAFDNLRFFGEMHGIRGMVLKQRIDSVLEQVGLSDRAKDSVVTFSGGMKRRINIAVALLHEPKLLIMDEPTVGIDPQSRNHIFEMIRDLQASGVTVLYSTHYMEEVEALCDDMAIVDRGRVIAKGPLDEVLRSHTKQAVYLEAEGLLEPVTAPESAPAEERQFGFGFPEGLSGRPSGKGWSFETADALGTLHTLATFCQTKDYPVTRLEIVKPSLEAVFLSLTGTSLRDE